MVLVSAKEEGSSRRVLARAKSNIAADDGGVAYSLEIAMLDGGISATHVAWEGVIEGTAREILGTVEHEEEDAGSERQDAEQFLRDLLADGPVSTKQVKADASGAGYSWRTIERAKRDLGVEAFKAGMKEGWQWICPKTAKNTEDRHTN
jgi:putative DNA primase/helicase